MPRRPVIKEAGSGVVFPSPHNPCPDPRVNVSRGNCPNRRGSTVRPDCVDSVTQRLTENHPETLYRTAGAAERRRIQTEIVVSHHDRVRSLVRRYVPAGHREEGEQVAALGLLVALEKYDDAVSGPDRGKKSFWGFAFPYVRDELRAWLDVSVWWCKAANRGKSAKRRARADEIKKLRKIASLDKIEPHTEAPLIDRIQLPESDSVEDLAGEVESLRLLRAFCETLSADEARILLSEHVQVQGSRHHLSLVERATAFVRGNEGAGDGYRESLPRHSDTGRAHPAPASRRATA